MMSERIVQTTCSPQTNSREEIFSQLYKDTGFMFMWQHTDEGYFYWSKMNTHAFEVFIEEYKNRKVEESKNTSGEPA